MLHVLQEVNLNSTIILYIFQIYLLLIPSLLFTFTLKESFALHLLSLHLSDLLIICPFFFFYPLNKSGLGFCVLFYFGTGEGYSTNLGFTLCFIYFCSFISLFFSSLSSVRDVFLFANRYH